MKLRSYRKLFLNYIEKNMWIVLLSIICLIIGILVGIIYIQKTDNIDAIKYFNENLNTLLKTDLNRNALFFSNVKKTILLMSFIFVMSFSVIGPIATILVNFFKGFTLGFTTSFIISALNYGGINFIILGIIPQNIFYLLAIILASLYSLKFSLKKYYENSIDAYMTTSRYAGYFIMFSLISILGSVIESYIVPIILKTLYI